MTRQVRSPGRRGESSPAVVRDYRRSDRGLLAKWYWELQSHVARTDRRHHQDPLSPQFGRLYLAHTFKTLRLPESFVLIAETKGRPVGFLAGTVQAIPTRPYALRKDRPGVRGYVLDFFVEARARRAGVGRLLMDEAERRFRDLGCDVVLLSVGGENESAKAFYARQGYLPFELRLVKDLGPPPPSWGVAARKRARSLHGKRGVP